MTRYDEAAVFVKYHSKSLFFLNRGRVDVNRYVSPVIRYRNVISEYLFKSLPSISMAVASTGRDDSGYETLKSLPLSIVNGRPNAVNESNAAEITVNMKTISLIISRWYLTRSQNNL